MAPKRPLSFRVPSETVARLVHRAEETGHSRTALVERYVEEGLRRDDHPLIDFRPGATGRHAVLIGTRLAVWHVIETIRQHENSVERAAEYLGKPVEHVRACVRYYADYRDEIDEATARAYAIAEREEASWRRQQQLLV